MSTVSEKYPDWSKVMGDIENRLREYVPGPFHWTAHQDGLEHDDEWGICLGNGVAGVRYSEALNADDAKIREWAAEILGFPVGSAQDCERRRTEASNKLVEINRQIVDLVKQQSYWEKIEFQASNELGDLIRDFSSSSAVAGMDGRLHIPLGADVCLCGVKRWQNCTELIMGQLCPACIDKYNHVVK